MFVKNDIAMLSGTILSPKAGEKQLQFDKGIPALQLLKIR